MNKTCILIIEDDNAIRNLITTALEINNYSYRCAETAELGIMEASSHHPDLIFLDLGLPDKDGMEVIKKIRSWSAVPIIIISARTEDKDKIEALDAGADDYITKPFSVEELLARVRVALRRQYQDKNTETAVFRNGKLSINFEESCVYIDGEELKLTPIEYKLLCLLAKNVGKVLTHQYIKKEIWGLSSNDESSSLRVFMAGLRKKIEKKYENANLLQTHIGIGYKMTKAEIK